MKNRYSTKTLLGVVAAIALSLASVPFTLAQQQDSLSARGEFDARRWAGYVPYAWQTGRNAAIASGAGVLLIALLVPDSLGYQMRQRLLSQALRDRLKQSDPLSAEQLQLIGELLSHEEHTKRP